MTVRVVAAVTAPCVALIFADPVAPVVASPAGVVGNDATPVLFDAQVTVGVTSFDAPSENVPVALNWTSTPSGTDGVRGLKVMGESAEAVSAIA